MNNIGRIIGNKYDRFGQSILWSGSTYHIDRNTEFATRKGLPKIATITSLGGRTFDLYRGVAMSALGGEVEFACAVEITA